MLFKAYRSDRENGFLGAADDIGTDTGTSDRPVAGASLCRQRREVSCYEICGNGAGAWTATGAAARLVFGSSVLIKNSMGAAAVIILAVITLVPVVKLAVLMVMYQGAAALLQPVCDKRIISCIQGMAAGHGMLLRITLYSLLVFVLVIAITCAGTNVSYLAA